MSQVQCRYCGATYDLIKVEVTGRHADCTVFTTPCCGKQADDREWKSLPDFFHIDPNNPIRLGLTPVYWKSS